MVKSKAFLIYLLLVLFFSYELNAEPYTPIHDDNDVSILTPSLSKREIAKIRLANGLEAYIVSDPELDKSGAALSVNIGSWANPDEYPGMAHFLEHMLFLGTKKYPQEGGYQRFINEHSGEHNAYTMGDRTVYMFAIGNDAFPQALDQFAQFFIDPLFNPSGVNREAHAIDQEYAKNLQNDDWREYYVQKALSNPKHPDHRFDIGSLETVSIISPDILRAWYEAHYSANLMHLVIYSNLPLKELISLAVQDFSAVANKGIQPLSIQDSLTDPKYDGHIVFIEPYQDIRHITLQWELPEALKYDAQVVSYILGYENENSLTGILKKEGFAEGVHTGAQLYSPKMMFMIDVSLTDLGVQHYDDVIEICFEAINLLKREKINKAIFDEMQKMATIAYQYQSRSDVYDSVSQDADKIIDESIATYPKKSRIPPQFNPGNIQIVLNSLTPERCQFFLTARPELTKVELKTLEPWMGAKYTVKPISAAQLAAWASVVPNHDLKLPAPNPFIPDNLSVIHSESHDATSIIPVPSLIINSSAMMLYYAPDTHYLSPETTASFRIHSAYKTPGDARIATLSDLYINVLKETLNTVYYQGLLAQIKFDIQPISTGLKLQLSGYSEKAPNYFKAILQHLKAPSFSDTLFATQKDALQKEYANSSLGTPLEQSQQILKSVIFQDYVPEDVKAEIIKGLTKEDLLQFIQNLYLETYIEGVVYGNISDSDASNLALMVQNALNSTPFPKELIQKRKVLKLDQNLGPYSLAKKIDQPGNATLLFIEGGCFSYKNRALLQVLSNSLQEPFFSELRTKQQTGYIVGSLEQEIERELCSLFVVQSNTQTPSDLLARYELFFENFLRDFKDGQFPKDRFDTIKEALIIELEKPAKNLTETLIILDSLAYSYNGAFDWYEKRIDALKNLSYDDFLQFAVDYLGRKNHRRLCVQVEGKLPKDNAFIYTPVSTVDQMRKLGVYNTAEENICP